MTSNLASAETKYLRDFLQRLDDNATVTTGCLFCPGWTYVGTAIDGRKAAKQHRREKHRGIKAIRRPKRSENQFILGPALGEGRVVDRRAEPALGPVRSDAFPSPSAQATGLGDCTASHDARAVASREHLSQHNRLHNPASARSTLMAAPPVPPLHEGTSGADEEEVSE